MSIGAFQREVIVLYSQKIWRNSLVSVSLSVQDNLGDSLSPMTGVQIFLEKNDALVRSCQFQLHMEVALPSINNVKLVYVQAPNSGCG